MKEILSAALAGLVAMGGVALAQGNIPTNDPSSNGRSTSGQGANPSTAGPATRAPTSNTESTPGDLMAPPRPGAGGIGMMVQGGERQIEGTVVKADRKHVTIDQNGALVPFAVQVDTYLLGARKVQDLKKGDQVKASFEVEQDHNMLTALEVLPSGMGGSGQGVGGSGQAAPKAGTGGSGQQGGVGENYDITGGQGQDLARQRQDATGCLPCPTVCPQGAPTAPQSPAEPPVPAEPQPKDR